MTARLTVVTGGEPQSTQNGSPLRNRGKVWNRARVGGGLHPRLVDRDAAADASASESGTRVAWRHARTLGSHVWAAARHVGRELAHSDPYTGQPASIHDVVEYTRKGGWVPGEHGQLLESPGYAYGVVVAIPLTVILHSLCWVMQRLTRVAGIVLVTGLLWLSGIDAWGGLTATWWWLPIWAWAYIGLVAIACALVFPLSKRRDT